MKKSILQETPKTSPKRAFSVRIQAHLLDALKEESNHHKKSMAWVLESILNWALSDRVKGKKC
jgi:hypothetical protein